jgi:hypothetical protein
MIWLLLLIAFIFYAIAYVILWIAFWGLVLLAILGMVVFSLFGKGMRHLCRDTRRDNPWRRGGPRSASISFRREREARR